MRKTSIFVFICLISVIGLIPQAQAQTIGPPITALDPEAVAARDLVGFPRWIRDVKGIQLSICDQGGTLLELAPCVSFTPADAGTVPPTLFEAMYYSATANMCTDPLECRVSTPNGEQFLIILFVEAAAGDPAAPAGDPEGLPLISNGVLIRLRGLVNPGPYRIQTPVGNFGPFTADPNSGEVRQVITVDSNAPFAAAMSGLVKSFRGNGTAERPDAGAGVPAFPGFIGNGVTHAPLRGLGGKTVRVIGPPGSGIDLSTDLTVEGKLFSTQTARDGGFVIERGTLSGGPVARGVLFARTNVVGGSIILNSIAGGNRGVRMIPDPANPGRFFAEFGMGRVHPALTEVGASVTVLDAGGVPVPDLQDVPFVMQDTVTSTGATFRARTLTVNAASSLPGTVRFPGASLIVYPVDALGNRSGANLGRINPTTGQLVRNRVAAPPVRVKIESSLGGSTIVRVSGVAGPDIVTITNAVFDRPTNRLIIEANSNRRARPGRPAPVLTAQGVDGQGNQLGADFGRLIRGRLVVHGVVAPPSFVRVNSTGNGTMTVPVTFR